MPVCPNCEYEYVEGMTICTDCGTRLVDDKNFIPPEDWTEENWQVIYTSSQEYDVEMLRDNLESEGIKAVILSQKDRNFPAPGDFSLVKLYVRQEDVKVALNFIQHVKSEPGTEENEEE